MNGPKFLSKKDDRNSADYAKCFWFGFVLLLFYVSLIVYIRMNTESIELKYPVYIKQLLCGSYLNVVFAIILTAAWVLGIVIPVAILILLIGFTFLSAVGYDDEKTDKEIKQIVYGKYRGK